MIKLIVGRKFRSGRFFNCHIVLIFFILLVCTAGNARYQEDSLEIEEYRNVLFKINKIITNRFFNTNLVRTKWTPFYNKTYSDFPENLSRDSFVQLINQGLKQLKDGHTALFDYTDLKYPVFKSVFDRIKHYEKFNAPHLGFFPEKIGTNYYVNHILEFSQARKHLQKGDILLKVNGNNFIGKRLMRKRKRLSLTVLRDNEVVEIETRPVYGDIQDMFARACMKSISFFQTNKKRVGYIHLWGGLEKSILNAFLRAVTVLVDKKADIMILDLRGGIGGMSYEYLTAFVNVPQPYIVGNSRSRTNIEFGNKSWHKPVIALIDSGTRSGKEYFAYSLQKYYGAVLVGEKTKGALNPSNGIDLPEDFFLMLGVVRNTIDGQYLDTVGFEPDVLVPADLPNANGRDFQFEKAMKMAADLKLPEKEE